MCRYTSQYEQLSQGEGHIDSLLCQRKKHSSLPMELGLLQHIEAKAVTW